MGFAGLPWGLLSEADSEGAYTSVVKALPRLEAAIVLTEAGQILINPHHAKDKCAVAIMIGSKAHGLSRPQIERIERCFDIAVALCDGARDSVHLTPVSHHWRYQTVEYMTLDEWQAQRYKGHEGSRTFGDVPQARQAR